MNNKNLKTKSAKLFSFLLCILTALTISFPFASPQIISDWYSVSQWEIEICSKFGGIVQDTASSQTGVISSPSLASTTFTLQASKTKQLDGKLIYSFAWYVQPMAGLVDYQINFVDDLNSLKIVRGQASSDNPASNYLFRDDIAQEYNFTEIVIGGVGHKIPIVCTNC